MTADAHRHRFITGPPFFRDGESICQGRCACGERCERAGDLETALRWKSRRPRRKVDQEVGDMANTRKTLLDRGRELAPVRKSVMEFAAAHQPCSFGMAEEHLAAQGLGPVNPTTLRTWLVRARRGVRRGGRPKRAAVPAQAGAAPSAALSERDEILFLRGYRAAVREIFGRKAEG